MKSIIGYALMIAAIVLVLCPDHVRSDAAGLSTVRLLDRIGHNYLFRGGNPVDTGAFNYDGLVAAMNAQSPLPSGFKIAVINLLDPNTPSEKADIDAETAYVAANPTKMYEQILHPAYGAAHPPYESGSTTDYNVTYVQDRAKNLTSFMDDLVAWLEEGRSMLVNQLDFPLVIYFHCSCGCDRTGEWASAYEMQYMGMNLARTRDANVAIIHREIASTTGYGAEWYCFYLKFQSGYDLTCQLMDSQSTILPSCQFFLNQTRTSYWPSGDGVVSQWLVTMTNTDASAFVSNPVLLIYRGLQPSSSWEIVINATTGEVTLPAYTQGKIAPSSSYTWGYQINQISPANLYIKAPTLCLATNTVPTDDPSCHLSYAQSLVSSWGTASGYQAQYSVSFANTSPVSPLTDVEFTLSGATITQFWNIKQVRAGVYKLSQFVDPNSQFSFGYIASDKLTINVTVPTTCIH
jgi:hypothetical protein